ncbi:DUF6372 family protein [Streptomyces sp. BH097]|uniref:DUF6372 family protein n=1 Tax=Streptomyces sp. BH097 TaxID=3410406 RepID=UPI003CE78CA2
MTSPVLTVALPVLLDWEQHRPGGCRCLCPIFHRTRAPGGCTAAAEPGLLIRVETPEDSHGPLPVCRPCYTSLDHPHTAR